MGQSFKDLIVWQRAIELAVGVYALTSKFPDTERFGLTSQMRSAAVSVSSNIAEGYGRSTKGEYLQFLGHSRGSCSELETQLVIARALKFGALADLETAEKLCADVGRLLEGLMKTLHPRAPQRSSVP
ncbi:MAG: four helix bundle protein [Terracidiphilus sp.]